VDLGTEIARQGTSKGVPPCATCHGAEGAGTDVAGYPRIAAMDAEQMVKQLEDFRTGRRNNAPMSPIATNLTQEEIAAVSIYYAALPMPAPVAKPPAKEVARIAEELARWGDWSDRGLPACAQCHGPDGDGIGASFPGISGQQASYLLSQLKAWRAGTRTNDPLGLMKVTADRLTDAEVNALVAYYSARPSAPPTPAQNAQAPVAGNAAIAEGDVYSGAAPYQRGAQVYAAKCALCQGDDGTGVTQVDGRILCPPLWDAESYNWGAGKHKIDTAAAFIRANISLGLGGSLSDQEAWDVAAFVNSHERPQDPRCGGDLAATTKEFHGEKYDYYDIRKAADGHLLGEPAAEKRGKKGSRPFGSSKVD
jgi:cytochrome c553